jgi:hypothetical protein
MKNKTQSKLNLKHIKIRLSGKENLRREILEEVVKQGRPQGLCYKEFIKFGNELFVAQPEGYLTLTKKIFTIETK